ncbi:MAG: hypothetical protein ACK4GW_15075 [Pseudorhodobacter sp.]
MRWMSVALYVLAGLATAAWVWGYVWVQGLACAFGSPHGNCRLEAP